MNQNLPEGAEIKISGVGSTPIAVSTQLPAAVAQLNQKGKFLIIYKNYYMPVILNLYRVGDICKCIAI